jgi:hypothetical protein
MAVESSAASHPAGRGPGHCSGFAATQAASLLPSSGCHCLGLFFRWYSGLSRGKEFMIRHQEEVEREAQRKAA